MGALFPTKPNRQLSLDQSEFAPIKQKLCLQDENIHDLYEYFRKFDRFDRAYIDFDDFIAHFRSHLTNFVQLPYAERLFNCIPKSQGTKIFFQEFVEGISAFCLLSQESVLHFIFDLIDTDGDERITKKDILRLIKYTDPLNGKETFFTNFMVNLEEVYMKDNQTKMDFAFFKQNLVEKLMFLIWPAFSFQEYLRDNILGANFWLALYSKVEKKEIEIKNNQKKEQRMREKMQIMKKIKIRKVDDLLFKNKVNNRKPGEVADDSKLLKRPQRPARRSILYIKDKIQTTNIEVENIQK